MLNIEEQDKEIRHMRHERGRTLGELLDKYGAEAVVRALGVRNIAHALGISESSSSEEMENE